MKKGLMFFFGFVLLLAGSANAALTTIGTAQFNGTGTAYNLIWDNDNNGKSLVWLDYTHAADNWQNQVNWAQGLNTVLTCDTPGYTVDWKASWRLPSTVDGILNVGFNGNTTAGYNVTTSEMGHLFYSELGNLGFFSTSGSTQSPYGLQNTGDFNNLRNTQYGSYYWSGTTYGANPGIAWTFYMNRGYQNYSAKVSIDNLYGLAVWEGQVSQVPIPGTFWLLGSGLVGLVRVGRRKLK
jgi:hypothetical protein